MSDIEERLRALEIETATIRTSLSSIESSTKRNAVEMSKIAEEVKESREMLDRWDGGVTLLAKVIVLLCTLVGMTIGVVEYASSQELVIAVESGKEDYEQSFSADYQSATISVCKNIFQKEKSAFAACAETTQELYDKEHNEYYKFYFEYSLGSR